MGNDRSLSHQDITGSQPAILRDIRAVGPRWQLDLVRGDRLLEVELSSRDELGDAFAQPRTHRPAA